MSPHEQIEALRRMGSAAHPLRDDVNALFAAYDALRATLESLLDPGNLAPARFEKARADLANLKESGHEAAIARS